MSRTIYGDTCRDKLENHSYAGGKPVRLPKFEYIEPKDLKEASSIASAASSVGSYHHQIMGTIGGNICQENRCKYFNQSKW
jgi:hypothetical protein